MVNIDIRMKLNYYDLLMMNYTLIYVVTFCFALYRYNFVAHDICILI